MCVSSASTAYTEVSKAPVWSGDLVRPLWFHFIIFLQTHEKRLVPY